MARSQFTVLSMSDDGVSESLVATDGTNASAGATCLAILTDGSSTDCTRAYIRALRSHEGFVDCSTEICVDRIDPAITFSLFTRAPVLHDPEFVNVKTYTGYEVHFDINLDGSIVVRRWVSGTVTDVDTSAPGTYVSTAGEWQRWRVTTVDETTGGVPGVRVKVQSWDFGTSAWVEHMSFVDVDSPLYGKKGWAGFGFQFADAPTPGPNPVIRFDDWRHSKA